MKQFIISKNKVVRSKPTWTVKKISFQVKNPKTWKHIHKMFGIQSEISLLINCGKLSSLSTKKLGIYCPEKALE